MKKSVLCLFLLVMLAACSSGAPSEAAIQTAIAATEEARPTVTAMPTATAMPTGTAVPTVAAEPTSTTAPTATAEQPAAPVTALNLSEAANLDDAAQIYGTAVRQMYGIDHHFGGDPPDFSLVYIVATTSDGSLLQEHATEPQELTAELRQLIEAELVDQPFEVKWIAHRDEAPVDGNGRIAGGQGIVITPGNIIAQDDGTVQLPFYMLCGPLCLSGKNYVLAEVDGAWRVTGSVGPEIMG